VRVSTRHSTGFEPEKRDMYSRKIGRMIASDSGAFCCRARDILEYA
jgi:hypothetical protein